MSIIEKLGIKPIESYSVRNGFFCDTLLVRILEQQNREMLENAINDIEEMEQSLKYLPLELNRMMHLRIGLKMVTMEKVTGKTYHQLKELI